MKLEILKPSIKQYIDILSKEYKIKKRPLNKFVNENNFEYKCKLGDYRVHVGKDKDNNKYYILNSNYAIIIE